MQTVGQILLNESLPEELRDPNRVLDKKGINDLLRQVAQRYPEKYRTISKTLSDIGWRASQESGGYSFGMQHLAKSQAAAGLRGQLQGKIQSLLDNDNLDDTTRNNQIIKLTGQNITPQQDAVYKEALAARNPLAYQVLSGARGSKVNLNSLLGSDLLYVDHRDQTIPIPILHSYSEGLTPAEYWASGYGARKGVIDVKMAVQEAGALSKQLNQATHRLVVEDLDSKDEDTTLRGMPVNTEDPDNEGALLAQVVGPYKRNTVLTPKIIKHLSQLGNKQLLVRSPTVGSAPNGGVYARDVGVREHGNLPGRGEFPGLAAAQAIGEPISQGMLASKHAGGVSGEGKNISGFDYINQLVQVPEHFKGGAAHSEEDGIVGRIRPAAQGGNYAFINGKEHYIPVGAKPTIETGDKVEAGDVISEGMPNPAKIVQYKGIGEGRRYFVDSFRDALNSAGIKNNRRNIELLSRGLINHVRLTAEMGDYVPDDIVLYHKIEQTYKPRSDAKETDLSGAANQYLEKPVLHYTVGTKVRPSVMKNLQTFGIKKVTVHHEPAPFEPQMIRGMANLANDPDWMTRMYGSGLKGSLLKGVHRGASSDERGSSFVPSLAKAVDFGNAGVVHTPEPGFEVKTSGDLMSPVLYMSQFAKMAGPGLGVPGDTPSNVPGGGVSKAPVPSIKPSAAGVGSGGVVGASTPTSTPVPTTAGAGNGPNVGARTWIPRHDGPGSYAPAPTPKTSIPSNNGFGNFGSGQQMTNGQPPVDAYTLPSAFMQHADTAQTIGSNAGLGIGALEALKRGGGALGRFGVPGASTVGGVAEGALSRLGTPLRFAARVANPNFPTEPVFGAAGKWMGGVGGAVRPTNYLNVAKGLGNLGPGLFAGQTAASSLLGAGNAFYQGGGNPVAGYDKIIKNDMNMMPTGENPLASWWHNRGSSYLDAPAKISDATRDLAQIYDDGDKLSWGGSSAFENPAGTGQAASAKLNAGTPDSSFKQNVANDGTTYWQHTGTGQTFSLNGREFNMGAMDPRTRQTVLTDMAIQKPEMLLRIISDPVYAAYKANGNTPPPQAVEAQTQKVLQMRAQGIPAPMPGQD